MWTVDLSLTSVDFGVLVNISNRGLGRVKWSFTHFRELEREGTAFDYLSREKRVIIRDIHPMC